MAEVRVIARALAQRGSEDQLRALLRGMLAPTRAESGCNLYDSTSQSRRDASTSTKYGKAKLRSINTQRVLRSIKGMVRDFIIWSFDVKLKTEY